MDLKNGILTVDGFDIGPNTTLEDIENHISGWEHIGSGMIQSINIFDRVIDGTLFNEVSFSFENGKLAIIIMYPFVDNAIQLSMEELQSAKRAQSDAWMYKELGTPDVQNEITTRYDYDWGNIASASLLRGKSMYERGYIQIIYL